VRLSEGVLDVRWGGKRQRPTRGSKVEAGGGAGPRVARAGCSAQQDATARALRRRLFAPSEPAQKVSFSGEQVASAVFSLEPGRSRQEPGWPKVCVCVLAGSECSGRCRDRPPGPALPLTGRRDDDNLSVRAVRGSSLHPLPCEGASRTHRMRPGSPLRPAETVLPLTGGAR
jgi:hypothetical protein